MKAGGLPALQDAQREASDPARHVWLEASAGTGKTQVLSARVFRLLLRGVEPSAILCLTFTKAGAAEMADRVHGRLARWVRLPELELRQDLMALGEDWREPGLMERARTRFAAVLDAHGGGLRIQTIHSFSQALLAAFPVEAGLVPGFRPLDGREEAVLQRETLAELLTEEAANGGRAIADAVAGLSLRLGEGRAESFLIACARAPEAMAALPPATGAWVRRELGLPQGDIDAEIVKCCGDDAFDLAALREVAAMNAGWGTSTGLSRADTIASWLAMAPEKRAGWLDDLHGVWARKDGELQSLGKGRAPQDPRYAELATALHGRCGELIALRAAAAYADALGEALGAGRAYAGDYQRAKARKGAVDFDDLIRRTLALLGRPGMGEWVRFKLDQAIEHVLIDEAQDTNARQWAIVRKVAEEFFAGAGTRGGRTPVRTLFTVGDAKQAIFGFQGSNPDFFQAELRHYLGLAEREREPGRPREADDPELSSLSLTRSFRSTRPILRFVDQALALLPAPGLGSELRDHASAVEGQGNVALWPPVVAGGDEDEGEEEWVRDATRELAARIARQVKQWIDEKLVLRDGRAIRPQDVMILVRRRGELASLLVARLYTEGVAVAGVDRLRLNAPLAVQDLLAAVRFALQPEDDLSLASLLVSPLIGWTQDELMAAALREGGGLWRHLRATQSEARLAPLYALLARADLATPYAFLEEILSGPMEGRAKLLGRLGEEARDPIEELLTAALGFERVATPTLQQFLDWFDRGEVEIVRDPSQPLDAVRVMTAHGAKGLQAPVVILADATADPDATPRDLLLWEHPDLPEKLPVFPPRRTEAGAALGAVAEAERVRERQEHWRLFYVAATRAEERLVIAGAPPRGKVPEASWYALAERAMGALGVPEGEAREYQGDDPAPPPRRKPEPAGATGELALLPAFLRRPAPEEARPPRPLAPSSLGEDATADPPPSPAMRAAAERGRLIHALLERLPGVAPGARTAAAERWLAGAGGVADATARTEIAGAALAVLEDARFAELFGAGGLAEAPVAATLADGTVVSGTVDRLLVTPDRVLVVDFKTGNRVPAGVEAVPPYHLRQMAAYVAALGVIFPGRAVEAALVYTAGPTLIAVPPALLAAAKPRFAATEQS